MPTLVKDLPKDLQFVSDSQDVQAVVEHLGLSLPQDRYDAFFVRVVDGDYSEVWGIYGIVPRLEKVAYKLV